MPSVPERSESASTTSRGSLLLTGATGFLGSRLALRFVADGYRVVILKRSGSELSRLRRISKSVRMYDGDTTPIENIFTDNPIDAVVHCATNYGRNGVTAANVVETNLILPLRLLQLAAEHGTRAFVNSDTILDPRISHYSLSKRQFVDWMQQLSSRLACVNVALEHFYGPGDDPSKFVTGVIHDLVRGVESIALTPGGQKRDFIYVDDAVEAFCHIVDFALGASSGFYPFEVGTNDLHTIREFVETVHELAGAPATSLRFGALPYRENEVMASHVDATALRRLGWVPRVSLEKGLRMTIDAEREILNRD